MNTSLTIRPYQPSDELEVLDVWYRSTVAGQSFVPEAFWASQREDIRRVYLPRADTWIAEKEGHIIGFISLLEHFIGGLFIDPSQQRRGVGTALMEEVKRYYPDLLLVEVFEKNERARRFYEKCGFVFHRQSVQEETGEVLFTLIWKP